MTDPARTSAQARAAARAKARSAPAPHARRRKPSAFPVAAGSIAAFTGLFGFMGYQLATGHDPALGNKRVAVATLPPAKRVLVKRIEHRIIVTKVVPPPEESDDGSAPVASAPAPQTTAAAPQSAPAVQQAPVVVQRAPAPAPAPAPVVTSSS